MVSAIERLNQAATELQKTEWRRPRTPDEWQRIAGNNRPRDYETLTNAVVPMIEAFPAMSAGERACVGSKLNVDACGALRIFASSMAVLAVRRNSPGFIKYGLIALAILGCKDDLRDLCLYLATLHHSAVKLGIDTGKLFSEVASLASSLSLRDEMQNFPFRPPQSRELSAFRFREVFTDQGYDLVQDPS